MKKRANAISIIGGSDGPTSIFLFDGKEKNVFRKLKNKYHQKKHGWKREIATKQITPQWHSIEETKQYMISKYSAYEADESYPFYDDRMLQLRCAIIQREKPELIGADVENQRLSNLDDENELRLWMEDIDKRNKEMIKKTESVSYEMFPIDCHLYIISLPEGRIEIEIEDRLGFMGTSYSGNVKYSDVILKDIYLYYGVSKEDIDGKTPRYQMLESVLCM